MLVLRIGVCFWISLYPCEWGGAKCFAQNTQTDQKPEEKGFWDKLRVALNPKKTQTLEPKSVTERYAPVYNWIHQEERNLYDSLSKDSKVQVNWNRYQGIVYEKYKLGQDTKRPNRLNPGIKVFGWHPYWMQDAYQSYQFDLLSYVAWFSYNIDNTGRNDNPDQLKQWENDTALVSKAHAKQCKVLLTVSSHTSLGNSRFLTNKNLQTELIDHLLQLLYKNKADGIDLNFSSIPEGQKDNMTDFVLDLYRGLKIADKNYVLTLCLPAYGAELTYNFAKLKSVVDWFIVTGYDCYGPFSKTDGPVAPLDGPNGEQNIRESVFRYLQLGLPREKIILGLPYYGATWAFNTPESGLSATIRSVSRQMYREVRATHPNESPQYDKGRWGAYYDTKDLQTGLRQKCWFDDTLTLGRKFDWVLEEQLAGVGLWALGYDNKYPELWNLISKQYAVDTLLTHKDLYLEEKYFRLSSSLADYRALVMVTGIFLVVFLMAGLVLALFDWRVREVFFQNKTLRLLYIVGGIGIVSALGFFYMYMQHMPLFEKGNWFSLGIGMLLGAVLTLYIYHRFEKKRRNMP